MVTAQKKRIFVGLSGGVDSSVAALRLKEQGHDVVGVFIKVWHPDFLVCNWERERLDAMRVAAYLDIPFLTLDAENAYKEDVAEYMIEEYKAGRTPNPDVMCNKHVKFGVFLNFALQHGADAVATGHYAEIREEAGAYQLYRGNDNNKDQSYFLWTLTDEQRRHIIFPIGDTPKEQVRKEAERAGLPTAKKHDSQGVCFLGQIDMKEFLSHYVTTTKGDVLSETGVVIGSHDGALYYTLGQRHGFTISEDDGARTPHYVVAKDLINNTLTVADAPRKTEAAAIELTGVNEITRLTDGEVVSAQFRYRQPAFSVRVIKTPDGRVIVEPLEAVEIPSSGIVCIL